MYEVAIRKLIDRIKVEEAYNFSKQIPLPVYIPWEVKCMTYGHMDSFLELIQNIHKFTIYPEMCPYTGVEEIKNIDRFMKYFKKYRKCDRMNLLLVIGGIFNG